MGARHPRLSASRRGALEGARRQPPTLSRGARYCWRIGSKSNASFRVRTSKRMRAARSRSKTSRPLRSTRARRSTGALLRTTTSTGRCKQRSRSASRSSGPASSVDAGGLRYRMPRSMSLSGPATSHFGLPVPELTGRQVETTASTDHLPTVPCRERCHAAKSRQIGAYGRRRMRL